MSALQGFMQLQVPPQAAPPTAAVSKCICSRQSAGPSRGVSTCGHPNAGDGAMWSPTLACASAAEPWCCAANIVPRSDACGKGGMQGVDQKMVVSWADPERRMLKRKFQEGGFVPGGYPQPEVPPGEEREVTGPRPPRIPACSAPSSSSSSLPCPAHLQYADRLQPLCDHLHSKLLPIAVSGRAGVLRKDPPCCNGAAADRPVYDVRRRRAACQDIHSSRASAP